MFRHTHTLCKKERLFDASGNVEPKYMVFPHSFIFNRPPVLYVENECVCVCVYTCACVSCPLLDSVKLSISGGYTVDLVGDH